MTSICALKRFKGVAYTVEWNGFKFVDVPLDWSKVVYCGRALNMGGWHLSESPWSNRIPVGQAMTLKNYWSLLQERGLTQTDLLSLQGRKLACWCYGKKIKDPSQCHTWLLKKLVDKAVECAVSEGKV